MKKLFIILLTYATLPVMAQSGVSPYYQVPEPLSGRIVVIPAGTTFEGRIGSTIGSMVSKQGERFTISISSPVLANGTDVLIPVGAEVIGEVVQAVPASKVPHKKKEKPVGQLRVQITALKMPDGMTFPMVASLTGEETVVMNGNRGGYAGSIPKNPTLGSGVGYVGTQSGFRSVTPGPRTRNNYGNGNSSPVVTKEELMEDPILGRDRDMDKDSHAAIRSLVKKNKDLYIYAGSPLTIRLEAPFKIGMASSAGEASALDVKPLQSEESSIRTQAPPSYNPIPYGSSPRSSQPYSSPSADTMQTNTNHGFLANPAPLFTPPALRPGVNPSRSSQDSNF